jgi:PAS domain S-box-containing protein
MDRHKAEDALRESEERLRLAQLRTGIGVWDRNLRTGKVTLTPELEAVFGLEPGNVKWYADYRALVHPDDIGPYEAERDAAVRRRETFKAEYRLIRPDGHVRWILATGGAFYDEATGEPIRLVGNDADITERKLAELVLAERNAQLALAGTAALVGSFSYDIESGKMQVSAGYVAIHGLRQGVTESTRREWQDRVHPEDVGRLDELRNQAFAERRREYYSEYRIVLPDRGARWIESRSFISYDVEGNARRVVGVNIDVTERKELEDHKTTLISELDHRVKNVLATVLTVASRTQETSSSMAEFVAALEGRIKSMATTHELLSSRHWQGIPLAELVSRELAPFVNASNSRIDGPDVVLNAEAGQTLAMMFHELVTNAAKFGAISVKSGRISVRWNLKRNGQAESWLCIQWEESGGPLVVPPVRSGYGTSVMRELVPYELGGTVDLKHLPDGVRCKLGIPGHWLTAINRQESLQACEIDAVSTFAHPR